MNISYPNPTAPNLRRLGPEPTVSYFNFIMHKHRVCNEKHFLYLCKLNKRFALSSLKVRCLEQSKLNIYSIYCEGIQITFKDAIDRLFTIDCICKGRVQCATHDNTERIVALATFCQIVESIAIENRTSVETFLTEIFNVLNGEHPKKRTLAFIGSADSGKSYLSKILVSVWHEHERGSFKVPSKHNSVAFPFTALPGTQVYLCEEFYVDTKNGLDMMKNVFEGNKALDCDRKYKAPISLQPRPVLVTLNGDRRESLVGDFWDEFPPFAARTYIVMMKKPLIRRFAEGDLKLLIKHAPFVIQQFFLKYHKENTSVTDYTLGVLQEYNNKYF